MGVIAGECIRIPRVGDRAADRVEGLDGVGLRLGEHQLALRLGEAGASGDTRATSGDEVTGDGDLAARRDEGALVGGARVRKSLGLVAGCGKREIQARYGRAQPIEVGHRVGRAGWGDRLHLCDRGNDRLARVRVGRLREFGPGFSEIRDDGCPERTQRGARRAEVLGRTINRVDQVTGASRGLLRLRQRRGHVADTRAGHPTGALVREGARLVEQGIRPIRVFRDTREGAVCELLAETCESLPRGGDPRLSVPDAALHILEGARRVDFESTAACERGILFAQRRLGLLAQGDDLKGPLALLAVAIGDRVVERLAQPERLGDLPACDSQGIRPRLRAVGTKLGDRVPQLAVSVAEGVVEAHEQGASTSGQFADSRATRTGTAPVAAAREQHHKTDHSEHNHEHYEGRKCESCARCEVHVRQSTAGPLRETLAYLPGFRPYRS